MADEDAEAERKTVVTYIPSYQKEQWAEHAEDLGMSQSEFVRTMVQAGRRKFGVPDNPTVEETERQGASIDETGSTATERQDHGFERRIRNALSTEEYRSWDELLATLTDDIEGRLDEALQELQTSNEVRYSGRHGGYRLITENGGETE